MSASATIADAGLKRDGRDWREKRDSNLEVPETSNLEPSSVSHVTRVSLLALVARYFATNRHE